LDFLETYDKMLLDPEEEPLKPSPRANEDQENVIAKAEKVKKCKYSEVKSVTLPKVGPTDTLSQCHAPTGTSMEEAKVWHCHLCSGLSNESLSALKHHLSTRHYNTKHNPSEHICESCTQTFKTSPEFIQHKINTACTRRDTDQNTKPFACHYCSFRCHGLRTLEVHVLLQHGDQTFVRVASTYLHFICEVCHELVPSIDNFYLHQSKMHGLSPKNFGFKYLETYNSYWLQHDSAEDKPKVEPGGVENQQAAGDAAAMDPVEEVLNEVAAGGKDKKKKKFYCKSCDKWISARSFALHIRRVHKNTEVFTCKYCSQEFQTKAGFCKHRRVCNKTVPCTYPGCDKKFISENNMKGHFAQVHQPSTLPIRIEVDGKTKFKCNQCDKIFNWAGGLRTHKKVAHADPNAPKLFICAAVGCSYQSNCKSNYNTHIKAHSDPTHLCNDCGETFHVAESLRRHRLMHHTNENILCGVCGKKFNNPMSLSRHMVGHKDTRQKCSLCEQTFSWRSSLKHHMIFAHMDRKSFECTSCGKAFKIKGHLKRHCNTTGHFFHLVDGSNDVKPVEIGPD